MIIFYNKQTGEIAGSIQGRVHRTEELSMWIGSKDDNDRLVIEWKPTGKETESITEEPIYEERLDNDGFTYSEKVGVKKRKNISKEYEPDHIQKELLQNIEKKIIRLHDYIVDTKTKQLVQRK